MANSPVREWIKNDLSLLIGGQANASNGSVPLSTRNLIRSNANQPVWYQIRQVWSGDGAFDVSLAKRRSPRYVTVLFLPDHGLGISPLIHRKPLPPCHGKPSSNSALGSPM